MSASDYTETNVLNSTLRGVAYPVPTATYVSLHESDPDETNGATSEVQTTNWPAYARVNAELGGAIGTGWSVPAENTPLKQSKNAKILTFPANNGTTTRAITHWAVWNAATGGNMVASGPLGTPVNIAVGINFVFDINSLTVTMA
jgi:hypothetical protein